MSEADVTTLKGKRIAIIGGSSGVGLEIAKILVAAGSGVTILARNRERLAAATALLGGANSVETDLRDPDAIASTVQALGPLDHLVITAGTIAFTPIAQGSPSSWRAIFEERIIGPLAAIKAVQLEEQGSILLFSGGAAHRPFPGAAVVSAAVAGVEALVRALSLELAPRRVNAVAPGLLDTALLDSFGGDKADLLTATAAKLPVARVGQAIDAARLAVHLLTNPYITGTTVTIDGGGRLI